MSTVSSLPVEHLFTLTAHVSIAARIPDGPTGTRVIFDASSGTFAGRRLQGTLRAPGGDWATFRANGTAQLDVRLVLLTDDDATILMTYSGIASEGVGQIRTAPLFQTADERYMWLNDLQAVATGGRGAEAGTVKYEVYHLL